MDCISIRLNDCRTIPYKQLEINYQLLLLTEPAYIILKKIDVNTFATKQWNQLEELGMEDMNICDKMNIDLINFIKDLQVIITRL